MKIKNFSIKGYRTVKDELVFDLDRMVTFVGPNNSGKTNTLKAIKAFFTGYENNFGYIFESDTCKGEKSLRTNIQITVGDISGEGDKDLKELVNQIRNTLKVTIGSSDEITLYLTFTPNSNPVYRVFPNSKSPKGSEGVAYSRLVRRLFEAIFDKVTIHYIPSEKSIGELYKGLVEPFLFKKMHDVIKSDLPKLDAALIKIAGEMNAFLNGGGINGFSASFSLPKKPESFFKDVNFNLTDTNETSVFQKGMGIQSAVLMSSFCWIAQQEKLEGKLSLWLLEEPESYLHPEMVEQCLKLLDQLSKNAQVITTTHSLGFVPQDPEKVIGVRLAEGWTASEKFKTYHEATKKIRSALGVRFSDYYNFSRYNILVEGQTDRGYLDSVFFEIRKHEHIRDLYPILLSSELSIQDFGGTSGLEGFLRATFEFIKNERASITIFDGDDAGDKARRNLQGYFGNKKIVFNSNKDFIIVRDRFPIEGLLPDPWIKEIQSEHPGWFSEFAEDASGGILPFKIKDNNKEQYLNKFRELISSRDINDWIPIWKPVLDACEASLSDQDNIIYH